MTELTEIIEKDTCNRCQEHVENIGALEALLMLVTFTGPIIGMLIGLFAAKKLLKGE